uniref:RNA methyltransferase n=1 Tax=Acrobeloides nanus TaxID=290746 RepID=A0A914C6M5_9BILA
MDQQPTTSLKRPAAESSDLEPQSKKRQIIPPDGRTRRGGRPSELHFVKGGTASDPLNLGSVKPEDPSSPEKPLELIVPKNIRDPLNINTPQTIRGKKKKKKDGLDEDMIVSPVINAQRRHSIRGKGQTLMRFPSPSNDIELPGTSREPTPVPKASKKSELNLRYRYGNFNRYYGDRYGGMLAVMRGIDIDPHLVGAARKNIRHLADRDSKWVGKFPASFGLKFGPLAVPSTSVTQEFPNNIWFRCENYVLGNDELLNKVSEEYDTILALSVTKWVHLNFGDAGIKRFFKRLFRELLPNGRLILEAQTFDSYKKRAKMTDEIFQNFKDIRFMPDQFKDYLLSEDVGFKHCEDLGICLPTYFGYTRPLHIYYKGQLLGADEETPQITLPSLPLALQPTPVRLLQEPEWDLGNGKNGFIDRH